MKMYQKLIQLSKGNAAGPHGPNKKQQNKKRRAQARQEQIAQDN